MSERVNEEVGEAEHVFNFGHGSEEDSGHGSEEGSEDGTDYDSDYDSEYYDGSDYGSDYDRVTRFRNCQNADENLVEAAGFGDLAGVMSVINIGAGTVGVFAAQTAIHEACKRNHMHIVGYLLNEPRLVLNGEKDISFFCYALHCACRLMRYGLVEYIVREFVANFPGEYEEFNTQVGVLCGYSRVFKTDMFATECIVGLLLHHGDHYVDTDIMRETNYFGLYNLYCEYNYIDKLGDKKYMELVRKHPVYVMFMGSKVCNTMKGKNYLDMLPSEMYRLILQY